jgi:phosphoglycerate kinase
VGTLHDGDVILLENVRINEGEKKNDPAFAKALASLADIFVNEAFPVSHRAHASVVAITEFLPSYAGFVFEEEVAHLRAAFHPKHPFIFILGGAKFETKVPLIEKFMETADTVFVGGALANNFFKERGLNVGSSLVSPEDFNLKRYFNNPKLIVPVDVIVTDSSGIIKNKKVNEIADGDTILDAGNKTVSNLKDLIASKPAQILWNGPLGAYEKGFKEPTITIAKAIAESSVKDGVNSIVGGADTLATIAEIKESTGKIIESDFSFVSTGGGAMLDFLAHETLPGIDALEKSATKSY